MKTKRDVPRRGVAAVELALTLPILVAFTFGAIETCNLIFLRQALVSTTYEAARVAIQNNATTADADARAQQVLAGRGITNATIVFNPADVENTARGTPIAVTVTVPADTFSIIPILNINTTNMSATTNMVKE